MEELSKHMELSQQLASWWTAQTDFKTKRALADYLEIHPDTLGDYFSGRKFPRPDIASKIGGITKVPCLNSYTEAPSFSDPGLQMVASAPTQLSRSRQGHQAVVMSLKRTKCPFCEHSVERFQNCVQCGQHFVWANVPIGQDDSSSYDGSRVQRLESQPSEVGGGA